MSASISVASEPKRSARWAAGEPDLRLAVAVGANQTEPLGAAPRPATEPLQHRVDGVLGHARGTS